jgi:hypothetical protein
MTRHARTRRPSLTVNTLEGRDLMAAIGFDAPTGVLTITGSAQNDVAKVSVVGGQVKASLTCYSTAPPNLSFFSDTKTFAYSAVKEVKFYGLDGDDKFTNLTFKKSTADGGLGNDVLTGGFGTDFLIGNYGDDCLTGSTGDDVLWGSGGHDSLCGGSGKDVLKGHGGNDRLAGGDGADQLFGGTGNDRLYGEGGQDVIVAVGGGYDVIAGGAQWDNVWMDPTDAMTDTSAGELTYRYVHKVSQFEGYSFDGGDTSTPVDKELDGPNLADPEPEAGILWSHDFSDKPLFASTGPNADDVFQGSTGDCYFVARLSAIADANPEVIRKMVVDLGDGTYAVRFYRNGQPEYVRVDADLYWDPVSGKPTYAKLGRQESIWVPIIEKAYAFWRFQEGSYESIAGGNGTTNEDLGLTQKVKELAEPVSPQQVINWVAAGKPDGWTKLYIQTAVRSFLNWVKAERLAGNAIVVGARSSLSNTINLQLDDPTTDANESTWRRGQHVFMVDRVLTDASGTPTGLVVRNPYGTQGPNHDGYITITDFSRIYFCISRAVSTQV